jgi:ribosome-binding protein aMBF1 (putative translation factor)
VIRPEQLEIRLAHMDALVDTILDCELFLDEIFPRQEPTAPKSPAADIPRHGHKSEAEIAKTAAARIRQERKARGWRQQDLAEITHIARPNIARLESGRRMPKISTLQKIADAMELCVEDLMG